jgi:hypothetical protein
MQSATVATGPAGRRPAVPGSAAGGDVLVIDELLAHYHQRRPHRGLALAVPEPEAQEVRSPQVNPLGLATQLSSRRRGASCGGEIDLVGYSMRRRRSYEVTDEPAPTGRG